MRKPYGSATNRRANRPLAIVAGGFALAWLLALLLPGIMETAALRATDQYFLLRHRLFGAEPLSPAIIHVDLDDASLESLPKTAERAELVSRIISVLTRCRAAAIALDMLFVEGAESRHLQELAAAISRSDRVYSPVMLRPESGGRSPLPARSPLTPEAIGAWSAPPGVSWTFPAAVAAFPGRMSIATAARGIGHINVSPDRDGVYRRVPLFYLYGGKLVPTLAFRMVCDYLGISPERIRGEAAHHILLPGARFPDGRTRNIRIPVDGKGRMLVNFAGPWADSFPHYPALLFWRAEEDEGLSEQLADELEGDLVIVDDVSSGGKDFGPVPLEDFSPLGGIHANLANSLLTSRMLTETPPWGEAAITVGLAALVGGLALRLRGVPFLLLCAASLLVFLGACGGCFALAHLVIDPVIHSLGLVFAAAGVSGFGYLEQERLRSAFRARVEHYFSPLLLEKIVNHPAMLEGCEKKELTVLFSDIVGFSTWSAAQSPEAIRSMLNEYFSEMARIVFSHEGTIDKYIGDGMLVFFGDPVAQPDHAERAVRSALEMQRAVSSLREKWKAKDGMQIQVRIGINTGEVVVGNMGSENRLDYTVIGSNVNLAQRLEGNAQPGQILISPTTRDALGASLPVSPLGTIHAKGFSQPIEVFTVTLGGNE